MNTDKTYDLLIVGAGPGGYVSAIRATQLGLDTAIIEKDAVGGVCLNVGCIPSKALIHQAEIYRSIEALTELGLTVDRSGFNYKKVSAKASRAANRLSKGVAFLLAKNKVDLIKAEVNAIRSGEIELVNGQTLRAKKIIIATGSRPKTIGGFETDEKTILTSTGALALETLPASILIIGAGAIGCEFAHIFNAFGTKVHLVEMMDHILPLEDSDTADVLYQSFKKRGIQIYSSTKILSQTKKNQKYELVLEDNEGLKKTLTIDNILVSVGRAPNTADLGLENTGVECDKDGFITVGDYYETTIANIYAIGDVVRTPLLAHVASAEGEIAVLHAAGKETKTRLDDLAIPSAIYCEPQIASFGLTEKAAREKNMAFKKLIFPYRAIGKAVTTEKHEGLIKILVDEKTEEIIGAHIAGAEATELIHELLLAKTAELLPQDIIDMIHAHPTLSEGLKEAMLQAKDGSIHS